MSNVNHDRLFHLLGIGNILYNTRISLRWPLYIVTEVIWALVRLGPLGYEPNVMNVALLPHFLILDTIAQMVNLEKLVLLEVDVITLPRLKVLTFFGIAFLEVLRHLHYNSSASKNRSVIWSSFMHRSPWRLQILRASKCSLTGLAHALRTRQNSIFFIPS